MLKIHYKKSTKYLQYGDNIIMQFRLSGICIKHYTLNQVRYVKNIALCVG